ncbi:MAG TPA: HAMP domain-containing sensor histidine kinase [Candidatus Binataceae bacterium]|nr:HAMP domain-containing sensor histidine kinase [Candidatus Binataceae bacterium]
MFGLIIIAIIIFAVIKSRRQRRMFSRGNPCFGHVGGYGKYADPDYWKENAGKAEGYARGFEQKISEKLEAKARRFEDRLRRKFDRQTRKYGVPADAIDPARAAPQPQFKTDAERQAYERARRRAAAEAGFYVHLMWYGVVMGFLFFINLLTSPGFQWWLFPAAGWGFGLASHYAAVFGWRWIHERVFEPAIAREVQREVTKEKEALSVEKQASLDELTATFAHEIRNPIAAAKSLVQQMGEDPTSHENVEYAKVALDELARVERSVSHLLKYAKEEDYNFESVNLATVLDGALTQMRAKLEASQVAVSRNYLGGPTVRADADKLRQVFSNIIDNSIDAMNGVASERRIEVAIGRGRAGMATVRVRDNGCGIAADKLGKIFNPFYTSKETGTGLGLGVAKKVIDAHRGVIEVDSTAGAGTEFALSIPLADAMRGQSADGASAPEAVRGTPVSADAPIAMAAAAGDVSARGQR